MKKLVGLFILSILWAGVTLHSDALDRSRLKLSPKADMGYTEKSSGLKYIDHVVGEGDEAEEGKMVTVHYIGRLHPSGKKFDSSVDRGEPFEFQLGKGGVIPGWEQGINGMHVGGERTLLIPPQLGYGEQGYPPIIPPSSTLKFNVKLLAVREQTKEEKKWEKEAKKLAKQARKKAKENKD